MKAKKLLRKNLDVLKQVIRMKHTSVYRNVIKLASFYVHTYMAAFKGPFIRFDFVFVCSPGGLP